jgi:hypothetical protein
LVQNFPGLPGPLRCVWATLRLFPAPKTIDGGAGDGNGGGDGGDDEEDDDEDGDDDDASGGDDDDDDDEDDDNEFGRGMNSDDDCRSW